MAVKEKEGMGKFLIAAMLSIAAGIASSVLFFMDWVEINVFVISEWVSVFKLYQGVKKMMDAFQTVEDSISSLLGGSTPIAEVISGLENVQRISLGIIVIAAFIMFLQVIYILKTVFGKGGRAIGVLAGCLTIVLTVGIILLIYGYVFQLNSALEPVNTMLNGLSALDAGDMVKLTPFPFITAALGLAEVIFAR